MIIILLQFKVYNFLNRYFEIIIIFDFYAIKKKFNL